MEYRPEAPETIDVYTNAPHISGTEQALNQQCNMSDNVRFHLSVFQRNCFDLTVDVASIRATDGDGENPPRVEAQESANQSALTIATLSRGLVEATIESLQNDLELLWYLKEAGVESTAVVELFDNNARPVHIALDQAISVLQRLDQLQNFEHVGHLVARVQSARQRLINVVSITVGGSNGAFINPFPKTES